MPSFRPQSRQPSGRGQSKGGFEYNVEIFWPFLEVQGRFSSAEKGQRQEDVRRRERHQARVAQQSQHPPGGPGSVLG